MGTYLIAIQCNAIKYTGADAGPEPNSNQGPLNGPDNVRLVVVLLCVFLHIWFRF